MSGAWQPIETAPPSRLVLVGAPKDAAIRWACLAVSITDSAGVVLPARVEINPETFERMVWADGQLVSGCTHWMPLPEPPA